MGGWGRRGAGAAVRGPNHHRHRHGVVCGFNSPRGVMRNRSWQSPGICPLPQAGGDVKGMVGVGSGLRWRGGGPSGERWTCGAGRRGRGGVGADREGRILPIPPYFPLLSEGPIQLGRGKFLPWTQHLPFKVSKYQTQIQSQCSLEESMVLLFPMEETA